MKIVIEIKKPEGATEMREVVDLFNEVEEVTQKHKNVNNIDMR